MRRESIILTACFALLLATFSPIRATATTQEDANAGIMTLSAGDLAFSRISDLIRAENDGYTLTSESSASNTAELYTYILKDVADDSTGDVWFFSGALLAYGRKTSSSSNSSWLQFSLSAELYRLPNGNWALKDDYSPFGLPNNMTSYSNTYGVTYEEGATFFEQYVACERRYCELRGTTFNEATYANYINYAAWDTDNGGVNNLAEWVRGTRIDYWKDDAPSDSKCKCGACCSCECKCGLWSGAECDKTPDACDCHKEEEPEVDCTCSKFCCRHKCECKKCADGEHSAHKNDNGKCDGTFENCSDCHKEEEPDEECTCANYCCFHTCECKKCAGLSAEKHSQHKNGKPTCDETDGEDGCECHKIYNPDNPEEECTCAKYCCYHTCECKHCASFPAANHSQHKNNAPTCNGTTGSGGCDCHETTDEEEEDFDPPQQPNFEELKPEERKKFLSGGSESDPNSFSGSLGRLRNALNEKFKIDVMASWFDSNFDGDLPRFEIPLPNGMGTIIIDFATLKTYSDMLMLRSVLAFGVFWYFISAVIRDVKKFL